MVKCVCASVTCGCVDDGMSVGRLLVLVWWDVVVWRDFHMEDEGWYSVVWLLGCECKVGNEVCGCVWTMYETLTQGKHVVYIGSLL